MSEAQPETHPVSQDICSAMDPASIVHYGQATDMNVHPTKEMLYPLLLLVPT